MRGGNSPARTEVGLVLRYDVLSVLAARLPLVAPAPGRGPVRYPPTSRRPPRLCLRESEWRSAQLHSAAQTSTGWLTDAAVPRECGSLIGRGDIHLLAHSRYYRYLFMIIQTEPQELETGIWVGMTCSEPCFGMRNAVPLTFLLRRFCIADFSPPESGAAGQTLSPFIIFLCQTAAPWAWLLSSGHWYYRSRAPLSISVWLTYLLQVKLEKNEATSNC